MALIRTTDLTKTFGELIAVNKVNLEVEDEGILSIIGPNGAGKTTLFNVLTGYLKATDGKIFIRGMEAKHYNPVVSTNLGIGRSFQVVSLFNEFTVFENVAIGVQRVQRLHLKLFLNFKKNKPIEEETIKILERFNLVSLKDLTVGQISHGDMKVLDIAISTISNPDILMMDEPMSGLSKSERIRIIDLIKNVLSTSMKIIMVEHDMDAVFSISDRIAVMNRGELIFCGTPEEVANNKEVQKRYLGERGSNA